MQAFSLLHLHFALIPPRQLWIACALTVVFAAIARGMRGVSRSGAIAGAAVCFVLYIGAGAGGFLALVSVFGLAWLTTRCGYQKKQTLGTAERRDGRTASQVLANLGIAAACAVLHMATGKAVYLLALSAALAEAAGDTASSEIGQASAASPRLITTWQPVPPGTDGGISVPGTIAGILTALVVSAVSTAGGLLPWNKIWIPALAGVCGTLADSCLGALLERRGLLNNDLVNFLSTAVAATLALLLG